MCVCVCVWVEGEGERARRTWTRWAGGGRGGRRRRRRGRASRPWRSGGRATRRAAAPAGALHVRERVHSAQAVERQGGSSLSRGTEQVAARGDDEREVVGARELAVLRAEHVVDAARGVAHRVRDAHQLRRAEHNAQVREIHAERDQRRQQRRRPTRVYSTNIRLLQATALASLSLSA